MRVEEIEKLLLHLVKEPGYKPLKPRVLAKRLELTEDDHRDLKRAIKQLVKKGLLLYGANHLVGPPAAHDGGAAGGGYRVTGVFRRAEAGFGFVRPAGSAPAPIAPKTSSSPPTTRSTPPPATPCSCG